MRRVAGARAPLALAAFLTLPAALGACSIRVGGSLSQDKSLNALRAENTVLKESLGASERRVAELEAKVGVLASGDGALSPEALCALPVVTSIEIDKLSGIEGTLPRAVIYVRPLDGQGRFLQATGAIFAEVLEPAREGSPARPLASVRLSPDQLRAAYRSSFLGTYYRVEVPMEAANMPRETGVLLRATLADALTGTTHDAELAREPRTPATASVPAE